MMHASVMWPHGLDESPEITRGQDGVELIFHGDAKIEALSSWQEVKSKEKGDPPADLSQMLLEGL